MSFHSTINLLNSLIILLSFINLISTDVEIRDPTNNRDSLIHEIDERRTGIQYVAQVLDQLDEKLANLEFKNLQKRDECIGIPGNDCGIQPTIKLPPRGPNFKRDIRKSDEALDKRAFDCSPIGGLPGADCEWNEMGVEAKAQKIMKNSIRNPGRKRRSLLKSLQTLR